MRISRVDEPKQAFQGYTLTIRVESLEEHVILEAIGCANRRIPQALTIGQINPINTWADTVLLRTFGSQQAASRAVERILNVLTASLPQRSE